MDDQTLTRALVSGGTAVLGVALLLYTAWTRHGGSRAARAWLSQGPAAEKRHQRMTVLGMPAVGVMCLCFSAMMLPGIGLYLMVVALPVTALAFIPLLWAILEFIPIPAALYPRWARPILERNRQQERAAKAWLRQR